MPRFPTFLSSASGDVSNVELTIVGEDIKKSCQARKHCNTNISESVKLEFGNFTKVHETKLPWISFKRIIQDIHSFKLRSINWKRRITGGGELQKKKRYSKHFIRFWFVCFV